MANGISFDCVEWLKVARRDLFAAESLYNQLQNPRLRPIENILNNCQQSAEKSLKAYIIQMSGTVLPRNLQIHDMQSLRNACAQWSGRFNQTRIIKYCANLDPFSVKTRYPFHNMSLNSSHAAQGINSAKRIYDFVCEELGQKKVYFP